MNEQEFQTLFYPLMSIPETENPALYKRVQRLKMRVHECIQMQIQQKRVIGNFVDADLPPEKCSECADAGGELCIGHELLAVVTEYQKTKDAGN